MNKDILRWIKIVVLRTLREKNLTRLDVGTLLSAGMFGYTQALQRFDPQRGVKFKTFAEYRIKGAVLDEVRKMIGDERCKNPRPRRVDDYDYTLISDNGRTQENLESQIDLNNFLNHVPLNVRELAILRSRMDGKSLREISKDFGFSESRASQLLAKIKKTVYLWYRDQMGVNFKLVTLSCPSCQNENCLSDKTEAFRCDVCDIELTVVKGVATILTIETFEEITDAINRH